MKTQRPYFLWDYDLTNQEIERVLHGKNETEKIWLISRILESAKYSDVWKYLTLSDVKNYFPKLKLKKPVARVWEKALYAWS